MRAGFVRTVSVVVLSACFLLLSVTPSQAAGVAILESGLNPLFILFGGGGTPHYQGGVTANAVTVDQAPDGTIRISDPGVLIVAVEVNLPPPTCTGGLGQASCRHGNYMVIDGESGDDVILVRHNPPPGAPFVNGGEGNDDITLTEFGFVTCGPGFDRAVVPASAANFVNPDCEVVELT